MMKMIDEIRRENLSSLIEELRSVTALAVKLDRSESQISQWVHGSINSGTGKPRGIRTSTVRWIEQTCGKPKGWLDIDHSNGSPPSSGTLPVQISATTLTAEQDRVLSLLSRIHPNRRDPWIEYGEFLSTLDAPVKSVQVERRKPSASKGNSGKDASDAFNEAEDISGNKTARK